MAATVPSENIHTPCLIPYFVALQPELKMDSIGKCLFFMYRRNQHEMSRPHALSQLG